MRVYDVFHCPKCKSFEFRLIPVRKWICKAGPREEEMLVDPKYDKSLVDPPPACPDFILVGRK